MKNRKFNWRLLVAVVVAVVAAYWVFDSTRIRSYTGSETSFGLGSGPVTVTNPTDEAIPVRLSSAGTRGTFAITSSEPEFPTASAREGTGSNVVHVIDLEIPPGETTLSVTRGTNVTFNTEGATPLQVVVHPLNADETRNTAIVGAIVIIGALLYLLLTPNGGLLRGLGRNRKTGTDQAVTA